MTQIKQLFDPAKDIYRSIEKVITYQESHENRLKTEISEYIVTESIDDQFEKLLTRMQDALDSRGENEVGVWVSGFYGSGKSSYTKYLGMALDESVMVDGVRFTHHLQDRMLKPTTRALLSMLATRYPTAVVMLDLASEMVAGATMEDVSTVLYYKVLQWAGYSRNLKVAAFERKLNKDGRFEEFTQKVQSFLGVPWKEVQNDPLVTDSLLPDIANQMYPALFKTTTAFTTETSDIIRFENERVKEMLEIVREATGKQNIIFIIDEVGQYVSSRPQLILNLDGLAKNLKSIGGGKVWIICTAQQTLTEDDPRAALNSPALYKLKDRFPIQVDLESSDIREICYRRLLGKSSEGGRVLGELFEKHGQALRHNTRLQDARFYDSDFDKATFTNLYPFLPAHFDILLHLLGALAKGTGGIGLRSAIKVIQDILVEGPAGHGAVADQPVGWLATTVTLYDSLEKEIRKSFPSIHKAVGKVVNIRFPHSTIHQEVAKTVGVLQILGNMPVTSQNVTSLTHSSIDASSRKEQIEAAVKDLISDGLVPFGEKEGSLCFFSEKLNDIEQERMQIPLRSIETRRIQNEALRNAFTPLPSTRLNGSLTISTGLKAMAGSQAVGLAGERDTIQTVVEFVSASDYETARTRMVDESRQRSAQNTIYHLGRTASEIEEMVAEIYRCHEIVNRYRSDPDTEVKEYCTSQGDRAVRLIAELQRILKRTLSQGSFIFRGQITAAESLDQDVLEAAKKHLAIVAEQVFNRYAEATYRADTTQAEKFLKASLNLRSITSTADPIGLVQITNGKPQINTSHKALVSIRDLIERNGSMDGKRLTDIFTDAPFGWSQDTLRYLVAALFVAGEIQLRISGHDVTTNGQQALDALKTNNTFKTVGVSLRSNGFTIPELTRASERLTELTGEQVLPLEDEINKTAARFFPEYQHKYGPLGEKLSRLGLPGVDQARSLNQNLADVLLTDASDATLRLSSEESSLYTSLKWANEVDLAMRGGLEKTITDLRVHYKDILELPESGVPGELRADMYEMLEQLSDRLGDDDFHKHTADLNTSLSTIRARARDAANQMTSALRESQKAAQHDLQQHPEWPELTTAEQYSLLAQLDGLAIESSPDLTGLKQLIRQEYVIQKRKEELARQVAQTGSQNRLERIRAEQERLAREGRVTLTETVDIPGCITSAKDLDELIKRLLKIHADVTLYKHIAITFNLENK